MSKSKRASLRSSQSEFKRCDTLSAAVRCALAQKRPPLRISAGLLALGLATHAASAWAAPFPAEIEMSSLLPANGGDGRAGFVLAGISADDYSGFSLSEAGDVNGDGIDDVLVGADRADPDGPENAGQSYVVFGRNQTAFPAKLSSRVCYRRTAATAARDSY
jgi:hypothetical protein